MQSQELFLHPASSMRPQYGVIVKELRALDTFITFRDTGETHVYDLDTGVYKDYSEAEAKIESHLLDLLGEEFTKRISDEIKFQLKVSTYVNREDFEPPENLVLVKNGILDIYTHELSPLSPSLYFEKSLNASYVPTEQGMWWRRFIDELVCPKLGELKKFCGYLLLNSPRYKKALLQLGDTDTGKSTLSAGIREVIGRENIEGVHIQHLEGRFQQTRLYKKTLNFVGDLSSKAFEQVGVFNQTTGGDFLSGEIKGSMKVLRFVWSGKHWFIANKLPLVKGDADSDAFYNRLCIVVFPEQISKDRIIKDFAEQLSSESEKSAILNWMVEGLDLLLVEGFMDTDIEAIRDEYKRASDSIYCFAEDVCSLEIGSTIKRSDAYDAYSQYCITNGLPSLGRNTFYDKLVNYVSGITNNKTMKEYEFKNLKLETVETPEPKPKVDIGTYFKPAEKPESKPPQSAMKARIEEVYQCVLQGTTIAEDVEREVGIDLDGAKGLLNILEREGRIIQQPPSYYNAVKENHR